MISSLSVKCLQCFCFSKCTIFEDVQCAFGWVFAPSSSKPKGHPGHRMVELDLALEIRCSSPSG